MCAPRSYGLQADPRITAVQTCTQVKEARIQIYTKIICPQFREQVILKIVPRFPVALEFCLLAYNVNRANQRVKSQSG